MLELSNLLDDVLDVILSFAKDIDVKNFSQTNRRHLQSVQKCIEFELIYDIKILRCLFCDKCMIHPCIACFVWEKDATTTECYLCSEACRRKCSDNVGAYFCIGFFQIV